jgi:hypothetical protein
MLLKILLLLFFAVTDSIAQSCSSSDCSTCINSGPYCYYYVRCGYCTSSGGNTCDGEYSTRSISNCPKAPTVQTAQEVATTRSFAYGTLGLGVLVILIVTIASYSPLEEFCGQKVSASYNGYGCRNHMLYISSVFLWIGLSLSLASPGLPWIVSTTVDSRSSSSTFFTAFSYTSCLEYYDGSKTCQSLSFSDLSSSSSTYVLSASDFAFVQNALLLGTIGYITTIGLSFPCAVMTTIAVYRYNRFIKYSIPPYISGCSPASLSVAQMIGWPSFGIFTIVVGCGISLASTVAKTINSRRGGSTSQFEYLAMPGSVAAGVSLAMQLIGLILVSILARSLRKVQGIGCNSGGCCRLALDDEDDNKLPEQVKGAYERTSLLR